MNHITIELCAEDRKRLDDLAYGLGVVAGLLAQTPKATEAKLADKRKAETTTEATTEPQEAKEEITQANTPAEPETPTAAENAAPWEPAEAKPAATLEQIQQKVVQLAAGFGGTKKAAVREIVNAYAKKVSDLPADKWDEVWEKLVQLESEG